MIESACMMLDYIGEKRLCNAIRKAIEEVIAEGKVRTYDMMKLQGKPEVIRNGAASTARMADAIIEKIKV
jgi:3-isopropylmalate dehydrogenase